MPAPLLLALAAAAPVLNNTDLRYADAKGLDFALPAGTTDEQGAAACAAFCDNHTACGAWVFVSARRSDIRGPRCAIKGDGPCTTAYNAGCISGFKQGRCPGTPPAPAPPPPPPPQPIPSGPPPPATDETPIFHVSPAWCHGGWTNDPNGPFELNGVHHHFYQFGSMKGDGGMGPGHRRIAWGHVAGNLSHWRCLPPALAPGVDYDGAPTPYDEKGVFTGSVTVVDGVPIALYPGEGGDHMCAASPVDPTDPLLVKWRKNPANPLMRDQQPRTTGPLGCTGSWREPSGNWTTTIQSNKVPGESGLKTTFWTTADYTNWTFVGTLKGCDICDKVVKSCSDFYPAPGGPGDRWVFGINGGPFGAVTGTFDRASLTFTPDRPEWASATSHYAYDYGDGLFPKNYEASDGRRVQWTWLNYGVGDPSWQGMQSVPRVMAAAAAGDPITALLSSPAAELSALRARSLASLTGVALGAAGAPLPGVAARHADIVVTFRGLARALAGGAAGALRVSVLADASGGGGHAVEWKAAGGSAAAGWAGGTAGSGPLAIREGQDSLEVRVLVDGCVVEAFWDGGRARSTHSARGAGHVAVASTLPNVTADVNVWEMGSAWLPAP